MKFCRRPLIGIFSFLADACFYYTQRLFMVSIVLLLLHICKCPRILLNSKEFCNSWSQSRGVRGQSFIRISHFLCTALVFPTLKVMLPHSWIMLLWDITYLHKGCLHSVNLK